MTIALAFLGGLVAVAAVYWLGYSDGLLRGRHRARREFLYAVSRGEWDSLLTDPVIRAALRARVPHTLVVHSGNKPKRGGENEAQ